MQNTSHSPTPGALGLAGSQHSHPSASPPEQDQEALVQRPRQKKASKKEDNGHDNVRGLLEGILALVPAEKRAVAQGLAAEVTGVINRLQEQKPRSQEVVTIASLREVVTEAVQTAVKAAVSTPPART